MWLPLMAKLSSIQMTAVNLAGIRASKDFDPEALGRQISMVR